MKAHKRNILSEILHQGTTLTESLSTSKKIYLANRFALLFFSLCLFFATVHLATQNYTPFKLDLAFVPVWLSIPLLNRFGYYYLSRILIICNINILLLVFCCLLGPGQEIQFALYAIAGLGLVLFEAKDPGFIIFSAALSILIFVILEATEYKFLAPLIGYERIDGGPVYFSHLAGFIGSLFTVFYFFRASNSLMEEIKHAESKLHEAQALATIGSWDWSRFDERFNLSNEMRKLLSSSGCAAPNLRSMIKIVNGKDRTRVLQVIRALLQTPTSMQIEIQTHNSGGQRRTYFLQFKSIADTKKEIYRVHGTVQDVSVLREAQQTIEDQKIQMLATSKMSALGEMAAGMAHEINTPLGVIQLNAKHILRFMDTEIVKGKEIEAKAKSIEKMSEHIAKILRGLRAFARGGEQDPFESIDILSLIDQVILLSKTRFELHGVKLLINEISPALKIEARQSQISQVLLNLMNNAFDALVNTEIKWISIQVDERGDFVEIGVTDSGSGIPIEVREKLMMPFFTTKEVGKGTGLGLSISQGIVKNHNGTLTLDIESKHTRFRVILPKIQNSNSEAA